MNRSFLFKLLLILSLAAAAVLWVLTLTVDAFKDYNIGLWAIAIISGGWGVAFVLRALFSKTSALPVTLKRFWVIAGIALVLVSVLTFVNIFAWDNKLILPIVALAGVAALLVMLFATGGKKWDAGDNQQAGYKDYWARRKEKEAREEEERKNNP